MQTGPVMERMSQGYAVGLQVRTLVNRASTLLKVSEMLSLVVSQFHSRFQY